MKQLIDQVIRLRKAVRELQKSYEFQPIRGAVLAILAAGFLAPALPANADDTNGVEPGWTTELGVGLLANPSFQGSSSYDVSPIPYFDFRYVDSKGVKYFANIPQGFGGYLLRSSGNKSSSALFLSLAPGFANRDPEVPGLRTFGVAAEARLGWEYTYKNFLFLTSVSQALDSGHDGLYVDLSAAWRTRFGRGSFLSIGPTARFGNRTYLANLYGVDVSEAEASGLPPAEPSSGLESVGVQGVISIPLGKRWRFTNVFQVSELMDGPRDSVIVEQSTQLFFLSALTRAF